MEIALDDRTTYFMDRPRYTEAIRDFYLDSLVADGGVTQASVGWGHKDLQQTRFEILLRPWSLRDKTVVDLGCGLCDLFPMVRDLGVKKYIGVDALREYCDISAARYRSRVFEIIHSDLMARAVYPACDFAFGSGIFNFKGSIDDNEAYEAVETVLQRSVTAARLGIAFNFLSDQTTFRSEGLFYASAPAVLQMAQKYSRRVSISQTDLPFEFSLHVWLTGEFDPATSRYVPL
jgi:hypothetical protein